MHESMLSLYCRRDVLSIYSGLGIEWSTLATHPAVNTYETYAELLWLPVGTG